MKAFAIVWIAVLSFAVFAQSAKVLEKAPQNFEKALKSGNESVVASAIFHSAKFKLFYPDQDTEKLSRQLERLSQESPSMEIRYKAYLAAQLMNDSALLKKIEKQDYKDGDRFFKLLAEEIQKEILADK